MSGFHAIRDLSLGRRDAEAALVPKGSIGGRALITVVAIMTFLSSLAAGGAVLVVQSSQDWRAAISREATVQIRPSPSRNMEADIKAVLKTLDATPGVTEIRTLSKSDSDRLLEPWLGQGVNLEEIPVPRMIVLKTSATPRVDFAKLRDAIATAAPNATLDDHRLWSQRLATMANTFVVIALVILALLVTAMGLAVSFATRGAMAGNREIIEVLHFVGASDGFISRQFQQRFLMLGLRGAVLGAGCAAFIFFLASIASRRMIATPSGDQIEALFGSFAIGWVGYAAIATIAALSAAFSGQTSRMVVYRKLRSLT